MKATVRILLACACTALGFSAWAQDKEGGQPEAAPAAGDAAMQERYAAIARAYAEASTPGPQHAGLARYLGEWDLAFRFTPVPGQVSLGKGTAKFKWLVEGRWVLEEVDGEYDGRPFKGYNLIGYDNLRKQYVTCWLDDMGTSMVFSHGCMNRADNQLTMVTEVDDLIRGMRRKPMQTTTRFVDENTMVYTTMDILWGEVQQTMEATYTRRR